MFRTSYKKLEFYQNSRELLKLIYKITKKFPKEEQGYTGIVNQMRRASISASSNIAEGSSRKKKEFYHFLSLSLGSLREIETQIDISRDLEYIDSYEHNKIIEIINITIGKLCLYMKAFGKDAYNNKNTFLHPKL